MGVWRMTVPGEPVGSTRPRFARGRVIPNPKSSAWIETCAQLARLTWRGPPVDAAVCVRFVSVHKRPQRLIPTTMGGGMRQSIREREEAQYGDLTVRIPQIVKPDVDNIAKCVMDGLVRGGVLSDDTRVAVLEGRKRYVALRSDSPCVEIEVERVTRG